MKFLSKIPAPVVDFLKPICPNRGATFARVAQSVTVKTADFRDCGVVACDNRFSCAYACDTGAGARARARVYIRVLSLSHCHIKYINKYVFDFIMFFCGVAGVASVAFGK